MKLSLPALALALLATILTPSPAQAYDSDGPTQVPSWARASRRDLPQMYQPTQRYRGPGYVVYYHYVPVDTRARFTPLFGAKDLQLTGDQFLAAGPAGPRVVVRVRGYERRTTTRTTTTTMTGYEK